MLVIAGIGIKLISHITHEVKLAIADAEKVFYISFNDAMDTYIQKLNPNSESLNHFYEQMPNRQATYLAMKDRVVSTVTQEKQRVCFVFYGHPCVFATPGRLAARELEKLGYPWTVLPGISALDCIFSDLLIDASLGFAAFEATELVMNQRVIDTSLYLTLWQPAMFKNPSTIESRTSIEGEKAFRGLVEYLSRFYPDQKEIIIYRAAMFPGQKHSAQTVQLSALTLSQLPLESTLVIPPIDPAHQRVDYCNNIL